MPEIFDPTVIDARTLDQADPSMPRGAFVETWSNTGFPHFCDGRCARGGNAAMLCDAPVCCRVQAAA